MRPRYEVGEASSATKELLASEAADLICDGDVVAISGSGGGILESNKILKAIEARFLTTGSPAALTVIHALGIGDAKELGLNHLAHEGLVKRVIGGHWSWSPRMQDLAMRDLIEAYALPAGVISGMLRESGAKRPGFITKVGLASFVDPRKSGGKLNAAAVDEIVEVVEFQGEEYLRYLPQLVDIGIIRGSTADHSGNISFEEEPAFLDSFAVALAARGNGGLVFAQVKNIVPNGNIQPAAVHVPCTLSDYMIVDSRQAQTYQSAFNKNLISAGESISTYNSNLLDLGCAKLVIARRASQEIAPGDVVNVGFGISSNVVDILKAEDILTEVKLVIEQGPIGGIPASGALFGVSENPEAIISSSSQFDTFSARIIDVAVLGMGELDVHGNVNVSKLGGKVIGPGGFIDIVHGAKKIVFCGTFSTKGLEVNLLNSALEIKQEGLVRKVVANVEQITFSASQALIDGRKAIYITERAVFELTNIGIKLLEIAPGIDPVNDVLNLLPPGVDSRNWKFMPAQIFTELE
jgi:propionate CoA-transferase